MIDQMLCISRRTPSLLTPDLLPTGPFCSLIPLLHDCSLCNLLGAAILRLAGRSCRRLAHTLSSVSVRARDGDDHPHTAGSEQAACDASRNGQNADGCSIV
jgi:hypothetical protein